MVVNAHSVSQRLRARGIRTGLRYTQTGYVLHDGSALPDHGVMVTRKKQSRYSGMVDAGEVRIYPVSDPEGITHSEEFAAQVEAALTDAGYTFTRTRDGSMFTIPDSEEGEQ